MHDWDRVGTLPRDAPVQRTDAVGADGEIGQMIFVFVQQLQRVVVTVDHVAADLKHRAQPFIDVVVHLKILLTGGSRVLVATQLHIVFRHGAYGVGIDHGIAHAGHQKSRPIVSINIRIVIIGNHLIA